MAAGVVIIVMTYFPIIFVVSNSLKTGNDIFTSGVFSLFTQFDYENYVQAWSGVSQPLLNTIIVAALSIVLGVSAAALGAYAFSQLQFRGKNLLFLAYIALLLIPWTLTLIPLFLTIQKLHLFNTWWALVLPYAASAQPLLVLIFRGFFDQIPKEILESARVDGCPERRVLLQDRRPADQAGPAHRRDPGHHQRLGRLPVAHHRHPGPAPHHHLGRRRSSSSAASA